MLSKEQAPTFFGCILSSTCLEFTWRKFQDLKEVNWVLSITQISLGSNKNDNSKNVVEVEVNVGDDTKSYVIANLRKNHLESFPINQLFDKDVTFKLVEGSGPVYITGYKYQNPTFNNMFDFEDEDQEPSVESEDDEAQFLEFIMHPNNLDNSIYSRELLIQIVTQITGDLTSNISEIERRLSPQQMFSFLHYFSKLFPNFTPIRTSLPFPDYTTENSHECECNDCFSSIVDHFNICNCPDESEEQDSNTDDDFMYSNEYYDEMNNDLEHDYSNSHESNYHYEPRNLNYAITRLKKLENWPRDKTRFINYMNNNLHIHDKKIINKAWRWVCKRRQS